EEDEMDRRKRLEDVLTRAVQFTAKAQTRRKGSKTSKDCGGWYYTSNLEGHGSDEGSVTITQLQALRAARNAGISVPKETIDKAVAYLEECTNDDGGVIYSLSRGHRDTGRPALTAAAISCGFSAGDYSSPAVKKWLQYCQRSIQP